jgi:hypothetical protein
MDLVAINETIFDEFHRTTGSTCRFEFALWWARTVRLVSGEAGPSWALLTREERLQAVRAHLATKPPHRWPSLQLIAGGVA